MIFSLFFLKGYFNLMSRVTSLQVNPNLLGLFFFFNIEFLSRSRVHDFFTFLFKRLSQSHVWDYELHKLTRIYLRYFSFSFFLFLKSVTLRHCVSLKFEFYNFIQFFYGVILISWWDHKFGWLTQVGSGLFFLFLLIFFNFILQHFMYWELSFNLFFILFL